MPEVIPICCPECVNDKHVNCTIQLLEAVPEHPHEAQWVMCPCPCGRGLKAWSL